MLKSMKLFRLNFFKINFATFSENIKLRKDYYQILGVSKDATEDQIKTSYRELAKKYHPDVYVGKTEPYEPNVDKFRDIAEAYAVLSNKALRMDYDHSNRNKPDIIYNSEKMRNMEESQKERNNTGNPIQPNPLKGSYAEYRLEKLKEIRKKFNVDDFGFYKGGVPKRNMESCRGTSINVPGMFHDPHKHMEIFADLPSIKHNVDNNRAQSHKLFMNASKEAYQRFRPYFSFTKLEDGEQYELDKETRRLFILPIFLALFGVGYWLYREYLKYDHFEVAYSHITSMKPYEYEQVGPYILHATPVKYQEKYQNRDQYHKWIDNDIRPL